MSILNNIPSCSGTYPSQFLYRTNWSQLYTTEELIEDSVLPNTIGENMVKQTLGIKI